MSSVIERNRNTQTTNQQKASIKDQLRPLNFKIKEVSQDELEIAIQKNHPTLNGCGLCKLVGGEG